MRQVVLDTETTGLNPSEGHRIIEIGCLELYHRQLTGSKFHTYLNPEREIDDGAKAVTGLTEAFLSDKPKFYEIVDSFLDFIADSELIIHNAPFDLGFLNHELTLMAHTHGPIEAKVSVLDTLALARKLHPGQRNNLDALCTRYQVNLSKRNFHGALLDAELLARVYLAMTAGQTTFSVVGSESEQSFMALEHRLAHRVDRKDTDLFVLPANVEEMLAHKAFLRHIQEKSGWCLWLEDSVVTK